MLKTTFHKEEPKTLIYRGYKTFSVETFSSKLFSKFGSQENNEYQTIKKNFEQPSSKKVKNLSR